MLLQDLDLLLNSFLNNVNDSNYINDGNLRQLSYYMKDNMIAFNLAGVSKEDISLSVEQDNKTNSQILVIEIKENENRVYNSKLKGKFWTPIRSMYTGIKNASYENGILLVTLSTPNKLEPIKIEIN